MGVQAVTLVDRFICRREGHKPAAVITLHTGITLPSTYITSCRRCGKVYEARVLPDGPPPGKAKA